MRFGRPLGRTREYVQIVRTALARESLTHEGEFFTLPLPDGPGKALRLTHTHRADVPIYLAAVGPKNLELAGAIADGWLGVFVAPGFFPEQKAHLDAGLAARHTPPSRPFQRDAVVALAVGDDVEACARAVSPYPALYVGGMGSREHNFYNQLACRMGYEEEATRVQQLYLERRYADAAAALPPSSSTTPACSATWTGSPTGCGATATLA
nr:LLM class flavin-dependent oxidoreductase [Ornithinimicrobium pratense]